MRNHEFRSRQLHVPKHNNARCCSTIVAAQLSSFHSCSAWECVQLLLITRLLFDIRKVTTRFTLLKMKKSQANVPKEASPDKDTDANSGLCVICFFKVSVYSVGECDHPVCFHCSTRMRVLIGTNECPICRKEMSQVR